jgi:NTP pyrophosphatase (non-canonical NTP hydrolase)
MRAKKHSCAGVNGREWNKLMEELKYKLRQFAEARDWDQFHSPKNLAMALSVEASEIVEIFQWLTEEESYDLPNDKLENIKNEIGDVLIYLVRLSDKLGIDPLEAAKEKNEINKGKYPAQKAKGSAKKYTEL